MKIFCTRSAKTNYRRRNWAMEDTTTSNLLRPDAQQEGKEKTKDKSPIMPIIYC